MANTSKVPFYPSQFERGGQVVKATQLAPRKAPEELRGQAAIEYQYDRIVARTVLALSRKNVTCHNIDRAITRLERATRLARPRVKVSVERNDD